MDSSTLRPLLGSFATIPSSLPYTLSQPTDYGSFTVEELTYPDHQGHRLTALLLIPSRLERTAVHPAVIAYHQHANQFEIGMDEPAALAGNVDNAFALPLLEAGYIVLCPEHIGFGRRQVRYSDGTAMVGKEGERWLFMEEYLNGRTLLGRALDDAGRAFSALCSISCVDPDRIGIVGHSMGGMMAFWLALVEPRIKALVSSCGIAPMRLLQENHLNHNYSMYLPAFLQHGDTEDLFELLTPKPLYLTFGSKDPIFPAEGSHLLCRRAHEAYVASAARDALIAEITDDGHGFTMAKQQKSVQFLNTWL